MEMDMRLRSKDGQIAHHVLYFLSLSAILGSQQLRLPGTFQTSTGAVSLKGSVTCDNGFTPLF